MAGLVFISNYKFYTYYTVILLLSIIGELLPNYYITLVVHTKLSFFTIYMLVDKYCKSRFDITSGSERR